MASLIGRLRARPDRGPVYTVDDSDEDEFSLKMDQTTEQPEGVVGGEEVCLCLILCKTFTASGLVSLSNYENCLSVSLLEHIIFLLVVYLNVHLHRNPICCNACSYT